MGWVSDLWFTFPFIYAAATSDAAAHAPALRRVHITGCTAWAGASPRVEERRRNERGQQAERACEQNARAAGRAGRERGGETGAAGAS